MQHIDREALERAFAMTLRHLRARTGIAQERLALQAGIDRAYVSGLERGLHMPSLETIYKLLSALGVSFAEFGAEFEKCLRKRSR